MDQPSARSEPQYPFPRPRFSEEEFSITLLFREPYDKRGLLKALQEAGLDTKKDHDIIQEATAPIRDVLAQRAPQMFAALPWPAGTIFTEAVIPELPRHEARHLLVALLPNGIRVGVRRAYTSERLEEPGDLIIAWKLEVFGLFGNISDLQATAVGYHDKSGNAHLFTEQEYVTTAYGKIVSLAAVTSELCRLNGKRPSLSLDIDTDAA